MKFACMSCAAKYSVPTGRLAASGAAGLRVRCSRCRAIMVVAGTGNGLEYGMMMLGAPAVRAEHEDTPKGLPRDVRARVAGRASAMQGADLASISVPDDLAMPAALSASGVFRAMPGVNRQVTGLFFSELDARPLQGKPSATRVWYAAIDSRPRGPFSVSEMLDLAERGKIRDATLVWRPGFSSWTKVRHGQATGREDLSWLRKVVLGRKLREMEAQERAQQRLGILPVQLVRTSAGQNRTSLASTWQGGAPGMPPALPEAKADALPSLSLDPATLREARPWRMEGLPELRASSSAAGRASVRVLLLALAATVLVALASLEGGALDRYVQLLS